MVVSNSGTSLFQKHVCPKRPNPGAEEPSLTSPALTGAMPGCGYRCACCGFESLPVCEASCSLSDCGRVLHACTLQIRLAEPENQKEKAPDSRMSISTADLVCLADDSWYDRPCSSRAKVKSISLQTTSAFGTLAGRPPYQQKSSSAHRYRCQRCRANLYSSEKDSAEDA